MTADTAAQILTAAGVLLGSVASLRGQRTIRSKVDDVHNEVRTVNGLTLGNLADRNEGQRILENVPPTQRTAAEQHYVEQLEPRPAAPTLPIPPWA